MDADLVAHDLGRVEYGECYRAMREFTDARAADTPDELWLLEHHAVYTLGCAGDAGDLLRPVPGIPLVRADRGGQITYHGPGQVVAYLLVDLRRLRCGPRKMVTCMEAAVCSLLGERGVESRACARRPGVYVDGKKIAAVGLRVRRGCCYHGLSLNVDMDLAPFRDIRPCGYEGLDVCQMRDFPGARITVPEAKALLGGALRAGVRALSSGADAILPTGKNG